MRTVLALARVALDHLVAGLEAGERHVDDGVLLVVGLLGRDDRSESGKGEVDTGEARKPDQNKSWAARMPTYGTRLVWNSLRSTFKLPSKRREAVMLETT